MHARKQHSSAPGMSASPVDLDLLHESLADLLTEAIAFVPAARVDELMRAWLARTIEADMSLVADALALATDLALFTPSASGQTAFDRLARKRPGLNGIERTALQAFRQSAFRLLRVEAGWDGAAAVLRDLVTGEVVRVAAEPIGAEMAGLPLVGRLAPLGEGRHTFVSGITPLDEAGVAVALGFVRPGGRGALPPRCAEAVYRHVVRHGTPLIPGLNRPLPGGDDDGNQWTELDDIAQRWAEPGAVHEANDVQFVRMESGIEAILDVLASAVDTGAAGEAALHAAYAEIVRLQIETVHRRRAAGSGLRDPGDVAAVVEEEIAAGRLHPGARGVLAEARRRLGAAAAPSGRGDADLDRLIGRIQALRAKTVEQGCTEGEAMAAAGKVAELLDRYGLSLSELELRRQACEGTAVETRRKRIGPLDHCVPTIGVFFDCRVWGEKAADGTLRYVFFGLPADVAGARYLYDLVDRAFETELAGFRTGPTYAGMPTGARRTATTSFAAGLSQGIIAKLDSLREAREAALRSASGRDLVVAKANVVDAELAQLGLHLRARKQSAGRRVMGDVYREGHEAGLGFEYAPGVGFDR